MLTVDLGASSLKLGEFRLEEGKPPTLLNYGIHSFEPLPAAERFPSLIHSLKKVTTDTGIQPGRCILGVSDALVRPVYLPSGYDAEETIHHEAQQNLPLPLEEMVWDSLFLNEKKTQALVAGIRRERAEENAAALAHVGMEIEQVETIPLALVKTLRSVHLERKTCSLVIDMGARFTHLILVEEEKIFCRSVFEAGHLISHRIHHKLRENPETAETLKREKASLASIDPADSTKTQLSQITKGVFKRLVREINLSIDHYREKMRGSTPQQVFFTGGTSQIPGVEAFLSKNLSLPTRQLNPLPRITIATPLTHHGMKADLPLIASMIGLIHRTEKEMNLLPPSVISRRARRARRPYLTTALAAWALAFAAPVATGLTQIKKTSDELAQRRDHWQAVSSLSHKMKAQQTNVERRREFLRACGALAKQRAFWPEVLNELNQRLPREMWITSVSKTGSGGLNIEGFVEANEDSLTRVTTFRKNLETSPLFDEVTASQVEMPTFSQNNERSKAALRFTFDVQLSAVEESP